MPQELLAPVFPQPARPKGGTFAIITVPSNDLVAQIHNRMPAILEPQSYVAG
jgi:putative SOS response-associated peptidase YedK